MQKIESIRPGGTFSASFAAYPLAELLLGILRANLTGRVDVFLHPEPRNRILFKDGVPVVVDLRDTGVSLVQVLVEAGQLGRERGLDVLRLAEATGRTHSAVVTMHNLLSRGALDEARRLRARAQMVRLFDAGAVDFRFIEGATIPLDSAPTILQPLPLVYQGLLHARDRSPLTQFWQRADTPLILTSTYPQGVDPFELGPGLERALTGFGGPFRAEQLLALGIDRDTVAAALLALTLAGMAEPAPADLLNPRSFDFEAEPRRLEARQLEPRQLEPRQLEPRQLEPRQLEPQGIRPEPRVVERPPEARPTEPEGLVIHRRVPPAEPPKSPAAEELQHVRDRVAPLRQQTMLQLLRVAPGSDAAQVERSYKFLLRRLEDEGEQPGIKIHKDLLRISYQTLRDPEQARRYTSLVESGERSPLAQKERLIWEAEIRVDLGGRALGEGRTADASVLFGWAHKLDPSRTDAQTLQNAVDWLRTPARERNGDHRVVMSLVLERLREHPGQRLIKLVAALIALEGRDPRTVLKHYQEANEPEHPLARRILATLRGTSG